VKVTRPGPLDEAALFRAYTRHGDLLARERLITRYLPLAESMARRFARGIRDDDFVQVASFGLIKAIDRFDPEKGVAFSSFAVPTIVGELKRYRRDHGWAVRPPRGLMELALKLPKETDRLHAKFGRSPTMSELAEALGVTTEEVLEAVEAGNAAHATSLDTPVGDEDRDGSLLDSFGAEDQRIERADELLTILPSLKTFPPRERLILFLRFERDMTQSEIAEQVGISQMHVSRLLRKSLDRLRELADAQ
jgi:RNA polymerase sigma-B factor